jgi:hypothetical protein
MKRLELNGSTSVMFFLHGQELRLDWEIPGAWAVSIHHNEVPVGDKFRFRSVWPWKRISHFRGGTGSYRGHANWKYPYLRLCIWSPWPKVHTLKFYINRVRVRHTLPEWEWEDIPLVQPSYFSINVTPVLPDFSYSAGLGRLIQPEFRHNLDLAANCKAYLAEKRTRP